MEQKYLDLFFSQEAMIEYAAGHHSTSFWNRFDIVRVEIEKKKFFLV